MSHSLTMTIKNNSAQVLKSAECKHSWDGNVNTVKASNLGVGDTSDGVTITSGYTQFDYYDVHITYADGTTFKTEFYCNSSYSQNGVRIEICNDYCNCVYTSNNGDVTGCYTKG